MKNPTTTFSEPGTRRRLGSSLLAGAIGALALGVVTTGQDEESAAEQVGHSRDTLERYVEVRRVISKEKRDWELGKELLKDRIELIEAEIETVQGEIEAAEASIAEADEKYRELEKEEDALRATSDALTGTVIALETRTLELVKWLPEPVLEKVRSLVQRLPGTPEESEAGLGDRFLNVVGILNEVNRFNSEITMISELRELADGSSAEVTALYLGIGQAYYITADGKSAGYGLPSAEGWVWTAADDSAGEIGDAIAILKDEKVAEFVQVPLKVQ